MTASIEEKAVSQSPKNNRSLHIKDENDDSKAIHENEPSGRSKVITITPQSLSPQTSSTISAFLGPKEKTQNGTEARSPSSGMLGRTYMY